jgi:hypothetical protein
MKVDGVLGHGGGVEMEKSTIELTVSGSKNPDVLGGPIAATLLFRNHSSQRLTILLPYPNPNHLEFECRTPGFAIRKEVERREEDRTIPIPIAPLGTHSATYYLNRYFRFQQPGEAKIAYRLETVVATEGRVDKVVPENAVFAGEFTIKLVHGTEADLHRELAAYANRLEGHGRPAMVENAEALAFLDTPLCVDYVARMLSIDNLEVVGIRALSRFPSEKTQGLIVSMLKHRDSAVVAAALSEIDRGRIPVPRTKILDLLISPNANTRYLALEWLAAHPDPSDLQSLVHVLNDTNTVVSSRARAYAEALKNR